MSEREGGERERERGRKGRRERKGGRERERERKREKEGERKGGGVDREQSTCLPNLSVHLCVNVW